MVCPSTLARTRLHAHPHWQAELNSHINPTWKKRKKKRHPTHLTDEMQREKGGGKAAVTRAQVRREEEGK